MEIRDGLRHRRRSVYTLVEEERVPFERTRTGKRGRSSGYSKKKVEFRNPRRKFRGLGRKRVGIRNHPLGEKPRGCHP